MVNGLLASGGPQTWRLVVQTFCSVSRRTSLQGRRAVRALRCCWSWTDCDVANSAGKCPEGLSIEGRSGKTSVVKFKTSFLTTYQPGSCSESLSGLHRHAGTADKHNSHFSEFPLSQIGVRSKSISHFPAPEALKGSGGSAYEKVPKAQTSTAAVITGRSRESSPFPA